MNETTTQINNIIDNLAEKLGVAAERLYPLLVKQAFIDGVMSIVYCLICAAVIFVAVKYCLYLFVKKNGGNDTGWDIACENGIDTFVVLMIAVTITASLAATVAFCINLPTAINALANPEWYAIKKILKSLTNT